MFKKNIIGPIKKILRQLIKQVKYRYRRLLIKAPIAYSKPMKIILGAAETHQTGWYSTNEQWLNITRADHWNTIFKSKSLITHAVAEHVLEHLSYAECQIALCFLHAHMMPGGRVRIAVPDGYNPNPEYIRHVGINGIGDDAADHKQLLNAEVLSTLLQEAGFVPHHLEGFDRFGRLIQEPYAKSDGFIWRSRVVGTPMQKPWVFPDAGTSLIVDGIKA